MNKPIIISQNLTKVYGQGENASQALRGMDVEVYPQEFVILFGPSGSGKSTFLNIVSGLEAPTSGIIKVDEQDLTQMTSSQRAIFHRDKIGMVFQAYNLIPSLSVLQNITLPLVFAKNPIGLRNKRAYELLEEFGLKQLALRMPTEISGGQMQRIGIMRALANRPPIIIADEPTGNLDSAASKQVMGIFTDLNNRYQNTLLVVTHDTNLFTYADRVIFVLDGKVVKQTARTKKSTINKKIEKIIFDEILAAEKDKLNIKIWNLLLVFLSRPQLSTFNKEELIKTASLMKLRITNNIDNETLFKRLDQPTKEDGAGLYSPTARHLADSLESVIKVIS